MILLRKPADPRWRHGGLKRSPRRDILYPKRNNTFAGRAPRGLRRMDTQPKEEYAMPMKFRTLYAHPSDYQIWHYIKIAGVLLLILHAVYRHYTRRRIVKQLKHLKELKKAGVTADMD